MFPIFQRYNFESNSQHQEKTPSFIVGCFRYFKDTILKAIHNYSAAPHCKNFRCFRYFKDTILKAIHNEWPSVSRASSDVSDISKIQF